MHVDNGGRQERKVGEGVNAKEGAARRAARRRLHLCAFLTGRALFLRLLLQGRSWKRWQPRLFGEEKVIKCMRRLNAWRRSSAETAAITFSDPRRGAWEKRRIEEAEGLHFPHRADSCNKVESRLHRLALAAALRVLALFNIIHLRSSLAALVLVLIAAIFRALREARHQASPLTVC